MWTVRPEAEADVAKGAWMSRDSPVFLWQQGQNNLRDLR